MRCLFAVAFLLVFIKVEAQKVIFRDLCTLPAELIEASGLATKNASSVWSHGDGGNPPELYLVDTTGTLLQTLKIKGTNSDWEDLTQDDNDNVYIGDFGNNNNRRKDVKIYIVKKISSIKSSSTAVDSILFSYPDQLQFPPKKNHLNFDCEAFLFFNDSLYLFTKNRSSPFNGVCKLYRLPAKAGNYKAELIDSFTTCTNQADKCFISGAAISPNKRTVALESGDRIWLFTNFTSGDFFKGKMQEVLLPTLTQKEGITFIDNTTLFLCDEYNTGYPNGQQLYYLGLQEYLGIDVPNPSLANVKVYYNTQTSSIIIHKISAKVQIFITNSLGATIVNQTTSESSIYLPMGNQPRGIYLVKIITSQGDISTQKIMVY